MPAACLGPCFERVERKNENNDVLLSICLFMRRGARGVAEQLGSPPAVFAPALSAALPLARRAARFHALYFSVYALFACASSCCSLLP
jgi:hypothetical protein